MIRDLYVVEKFEYLMPDGTIVKDKVKGGLFNFHPTGRLSLITAAASYTLAYAGKFNVEGSKIFIDVKVSNREAFINTTIDRDIVSNSGGVIVLNKAYPERTISLTWRKLEDSLVPSETSPWVGSFYQTRSSIKEADGSVKNETLIDSLLTLSAGGTISSVHGSAERFFAYYGKYSVEGDERLVKVIACSDSSAEGKILRRKVEMIGSDKMILRLTGLDGRNYQSEWMRVPDLTERFT